MNAEGSHRTKRPIPSFNVRRATSSDLIEINEITLAAKASWGYSREQMNIWRDSLVTRLDSLETDPTLVAEEDGHLIGVVQVDPAVTPWELVSCWIEPSRMRRGVGSALLTAIKAEVARLGQQVLHIDSEPNAEAFYLSRGAVRVGEVPAPIAGAPNRVRPQLRLACSGA